MAGFTNRGKRLIMEGYFRGGTIPTQFYLALATSAVAPTVDTNTFGELTEIAAGNGYTSGGQAVARNSTDFDTSTENDTTDLHELQLRNFTWTATGGNLPASGNGARYAVLLDDNVTVSSRQVICWFDLGADRTVSDTQDLIAVDLTMRAVES